jgi:hypothetical protein
MASRNADCGVCPVRAKDLGDVHRHQIFRVTQVRPDENLKMPILAALIIPRLTNPSAAPAPGCEPIAICTRVGSVAPNCWNMGAAQCARYSNQASRVG